MQNMHSRQQPESAVPTLLTARQVQDILHIDRSTVYRMAESGRLPAIRVGSQWRFHSDAIAALLEPAPAHPVVHVPDDSRPVAAADHPVGIDVNAASAVVRVSAELLGVMMLVTDMNGRPLTDIANPCAWFAAHADDPGVMDSCLTEWHNLAQHDDFRPAFRAGAAGFECARAFIRSGWSLVGMVLAGGVAPAGGRPGLHELDHEQRERVLSALPMIAATLAQTAPGNGVGKEES